MEYTMMSTVKWRWYISGKRGLRSLEKREKREKSSKLH